MHTFSYPATLAPDEDGRIVVSIPDLPGTHTDGADLIEALVEATDALGTSLAARIDDEEDIPMPSAPRSGQVMVSPSATMVAKAALYLAMREAKLTAAELGRRLGIDHKEARRLLSPREPTKMPRLEQALLAVGLQLTAGVRSLTSAAAPARPARTKATKTGSFGNASVRGRKIVDVGDFADVSSYRRIGNRAVIASATAKKKAGSPTRMMAPVAGKPSGGPKRRPA
jgi:antitoxin HicB